MPPKPMPFHLLSAGAPLSASLPIRDCLVVDDDEFSRGVLARQLMRLGAVARQAGSFEHGLHAWRAHRPPMVFIDCVLPERDGYALAREVRAAEGRHRAGRRTFLVGMSGHSGLVHHARCRAAGMDGVLDKPASLRELAIALRLPPDPVDAPARPPAGGEASTVECELRALYESSCRDDIAAIDAAIALGQADPVVRHAHRIEGASRLVGALATAEAARWLGELARAHRSPSELAHGVHALVRAHAAWQGRPPGDAPSDRARAA